MTRVAKAQFHVDGDLRNYEDAEAFLKEIGVEKFNRLTVSYNEQIRMSLLTVEMPKWCIMDNFFINRFKDLLKEKSVEEVMNDKEGNIYD